MRKFSIVKQTHSLDTTFIVFVKFNFMLKHLNSSFEHTFILDSLSYLEFAGMCARSLL